MKKIIKIGIGGPVGVGKTMFIERVTRAMREEVSMAVVTNDMYTKEDAFYLMRQGALPQSRIIGIETGSCPHTAISKDASMNVAAIDELIDIHPDLELIFIESGGDDLGATFSPKLVDFSIYIIDVAQGEKIPRKGGQGMSESDLFIINKIDLAPYVGVNLEVMERDTVMVRDDKPFLLTNLKEGIGMVEVVDWIKKEVLS